MEPVPAELNRASRLTIRARLTLVFGGLFLLAGCVLLAVTYVLTSARLGGPGDEGLIVDARDAAGQPVPAPTPSGTAGPGPQWSDDEFLRNVVDEAQDDALSQLLTQSAVAFVIVGVVAVLLAWLLAGRMLEPLHAITATARRIAHAPGVGGGLHERIGLHGPHDEVRDLADTFDAMLARLDRSFSAQRRFAANASHELRTPLAVNRTLLEVAARGKPSPEVERLATELLQVNAEHERLIEGLLTLSRAEQDRPRQAFVDLSDVVDHVLHQTDTGPHDVETDLQEAPTEGDSVLLHHLVRNLIDNAVTHNVPTGGSIRVVTGTAPDGDSVLRVDNTGPAIPAYEVEGLFEPFRRGAGRVSTTKPGVGLGLSIVEAVAHAHDGTVHAEPREDGGLVVAVRLPAPVPGPPGG